MGRRRRPGRSSSLGAATGSSVRGQGGASAGAGAAAAVAAPAGRGRRPPPTDAELSAKTRVVTYTMVDFSERAGMLSSNQWGFRPRRGTLQPLELLVMALEDAKLFRQNIYLMMVDFSAAFDTID
jgi:hypothetical protein